MQTENKTIEKTLCIDCNNKSILTSEGKVCPVCLDKYYTLCESCNEYHLTNNMYNTQNGLVCEGCFLNKYDICNECGEYVHEDNIIYIDDSLVCETCFDDNYSRCNNCDEYHHEDNMFNTQNGLVCESCFNEYYTECIYCHEIINIDNIFNDPDGDPCCEICYLNRFTICDICDSTVNRDEVREQNDNIVCPYCYDEEESEHAGILSYHETDINWNFHGNPKNNRFYGIEMEIETRNDIDDAVSEVRKEFDINEATLMEDGSITNEGFEIITHPASFNYAKDFAKNFGNITNKCKGYHTENCGMHIHFSRKSISTLTLAKFMLFFANNQDFIEFIAQRGITDYWNHEKKEETTEKIKHSKDSDRYAAINLQNDHTIEVRIFKSNLKPERVTKNIEFIESLIEFCENTSLQKLYEKEYTEFLKQNHKTYKEANNYVCNYR